MPSGRYEYAVPRINSKQLKLYLAKSIFKLGKVEENFYLAKRNQLVRSRRVRNMRRAEASRSQVQQTIYLEQGHFQLVYSIINEL